MDKDQVLIDRLKAERDKNRSNTKDGPRSEHGELLWLTPLGRLLNDAAAELESLRAYKVALQQQREALERRNASLEVMREQFEGLADEWFDDDNDTLNWASVVLRKALGDSHE